MGNHKAERAVSRLAQEGTLRYPDAFENQAMRDLFINHPDPDSVVSCFFKLKDTGVFSNRDSAREILEVLAKHINPESLAALSTVIEAINNARLPITLAQFTQITNLNNLNDFGMAVTQLQANGELELPAGLDVLERLIENPRQIYKEHITQDIKHRLGTIREAGEADEGLEQENPNDPEANKP